MTGGGARRRAAQLSAGTRASLNITGLPEKPLEHAGGHHALRAPVRRAGAFVGDRGEASVSPQQRGAAADVLPGAAALRMNRLLSRREGREDLRVRVAGQRRTAAL